VRGGLSLEHALILAYQAYRTTPLPAWQRVTLENSPSKVAAADQLLVHFNSAEAVVSAESEACAAPLTTKLAPGSVWKVVAIERNRSNLENKC
jgi:hypothetical protein